MTSAISTALSGLQAASKRVAVAANNIANASSAGSLDPASPDQAYQAQTVVQTANEGGGTTASGIPKSPGIVNAYAPDSPFANSSGEVAAPNVDIAEEAINLKLAEASYKANIATIQTANEMSNALLNIFDKKV